MKLRAGEVDRFCARPPATVRGALIWGDEGLAAERRERLLAALLGPGAADEMRLERLDAAALRADPAALDTALRARGFFPGPRAVLLSGATDGQAAAIGAALAQAAAPDAFLLVAADQLAGRSALRALFETAPDAAALPCYADPADARTLSEALRAAGADPAPDAVTALAAVARDMSRAEARRLVETLALHSPASAGPLTAADVAALAPAAAGGALEAALDAVFEGGAAAVRRELARLAAQGTGPVEIALAAQRRLRLLHAAVVDPATLARVQPPSRRDRLADVARRWGAARLERAMAVLYQTDAGLRGGSKAPPAALLERALLRVAG
jgi:DNA polymerase-3 subunit delta